jgi:outer membrane lipoprotein-sorting protein
MRVWGADSLRSESAGREVVMTVRHLKRFPLPSAGALLLLLLLPALFSSPPSSAADDVLSRSRAVYASLNSYADAGTVVQEYGPANAPSRDRHTFTTYFNRAPRGFYFDFKKESGDRYVIWGDPEAFHTWWKTTGVKEDYPNPNNTGAFGTAGAQTVGSALKIPTLLYSKAPLQGSFTNFADAAREGDEDVGGHRCYRLAGTARDIYGATGHESNVRKMTVWIDAESLLIRKVVEVPKDVPPGQVSRTTTTFEPQANPALDEGRFKFSPPSGQK